MTITASAADWAVATVVSQNPTFTLPTAVPAGATIIINFQTPLGTTVASVSDPTNGAYTVCSGPVDYGGGSSGRAFQYRKDNSAALAAGTIITVSLNEGSVSTRANFGWISSDQGVLSFDGAAVGAQFSATTSVTSNNVNTTGAGCLIGFIAVNNTQGSALGNLGPNESTLEHDFAQGRVISLLETFSASGTYGFAGGGGTGITLPSSGNGAFLVGAFVEPGGGGESKNQTRGLSGGFVDMCGGFE